MKEAGFEEADVSFEYFVFQVGDALFATPLLDIREVCELTDCRPIPQKDPAFLGLMNLRQDIIGVVDLRIRFGVKPAPDQSKRAILLCELTDRTLGVLVDCIHAVKTFLPDSIENEAFGRDGAADESIKGIVRLESGLIPILDLKNLLQGFQNSIPAEA